MCVNPVPTMLCHIIYYYRDEKYALPSGNRVKGTWRPNFFSREAHRSNILRWAVINSDRVHTDNETAAPVVVVCKL